MQKICSLLLFLFLQTSLALSCSAGFPTEEAAATFESIHPHDHKATIAACLHRAKTSANPKIASIYNLAAASLAGCAIRSHSDAPLSFYPSQYTVDQDDYLFLSTDKPKAPHKHPKSDTYDKFTVDESSESCCVVRDMRHKDQKPTTIFTLPQPKADTKLPEPKADTLHITVISRDCLDAFSTTLQFEGHNLRVFAYPSKPFLPNHDMLAGLPKDPHDHTVRLWTFEKP